MRAPIHPGEVLADELAELNITPTELARQIEVPANRLSQIIRGRRSITADTALRLGHWFGSSPQFWLNLQAAYDIRVAEAAVGAEISRLPVRPRCVKQVGA
ncbi:MAG: HigA family addiction module antidote protein [Thermomonas sp.]|uniref:HigA family addiction module antitoxin n=1 Tax=Thermomonas sp. TaxID=1971895 RepID=UPI002623C584|nr:HigA family addiction module antitoxin [Thermomonas sp.]MCC7097881.1 HigA family addiction module antidote protein [Thermomonas sp.]